MTGGALRTESSRLMIGIRGLFVRNSMTIHAAAGNAGKLPVRVTLLASRQQVRAGQRESRRCVVEARWCPALCSVALRAFLRKQCGLMIGRDGCVVV